MTRQIVHVSVRQTSKVFALMYFAISLLVVPIVVAFATLSQQAPGMLAFLVVGPIFYGLVGYVASALFAVIYNFIASRIGGVEFDSVDKPAPA